MASPANRRKGHLAQAGINAQDVASQLDVSLSHVCRVIAGNRLGGRKAQAIQQAIATRLGRSVAELWPEVQDAA